MNQSASNLSILGIDVSKGKFDVALLREGKCKHKRFLNNLEGFKKLREWLAEYKVERLHACMESTSTYGEALAEYLHDRGFMVSIVNPAQINKHIDRHPQLRDKQKLLQSIPGVGEATIHLVLANFANTEKFSNAKRLPALVALRYNPIIVEMKRRLTEAGKPKMLIVGAAMRKLIHIIYGVLKHGKPFDSNFAL